ncbi:hypothetical protein [Brevibacillus gelatini]|uniref:hypothetical protein n=1 Tax=Brevibacillus gelatini TaxID=1655277 RepID=UPI001FE6A2E1|nr:hypothetical protein [Brevibacillus gelatini]
MDGIRFGGIGFAGIRFGGIGFGGIGFAGIWLDGIRFGGIGFAGIRFGGIGLAGIGLGGIGFGVFGIIWLGDGAVGRCGCGIGRAGMLCCGFSELFGIFGFAGDGMFGDGNGIMEEGGFGISLGRLLDDGGPGGILRRFSTELNTSFLMKSHSTWYDIYPAQETTLAQFPKVD